MLIAVLIGLALTGSEAQQLLTPAPVRPDALISYRPLRAAAGESATGWKVYDVKVAGVSLVATYRESFAATVRADGIDGPIKLLSDKNRRPAAE